MRIALDAMGGDYGCAVNIEGLQAAHHDFPHIERFLVVGRPEEIRRQLQRVGMDAQDPRLELVPATQVVEMHEKPAQALRQKRDSSIAVAADLLKQGRADAVISAGHTGAAVAATVIKCRMLPGIDRPGIATSFPAEKGPFMILDVGANIECKAKHLAHYALLGETYWHSLMGTNEPRVALLNVGEEAGKGSEDRRQAYAIMDRLPINFVGNVDGRHIFNNAADVVVCDGFTGNVLLKACESLASTMFRVLKEKLQESPVRMAGAFLSQQAFRELKEMTDHEEYGGALLLGINGVCVIGHGSSSPKAIRNAFRVAAEVVEKDINSIVAEKIARIDWQDALRPPDDE